MIPYFVFDKIVLGPITLYVWGFFVALGFLGGYLWALRRAKKDKVNLEIIHNLFIFVILGGIIGAKLLNVFEGIIRSDGPIGDLVLNIYGFSLYGGIFGGILAGWLYLFFKKQDVLRIADLCVPAVALGIAVGRIGCFLINDHQGTITNLPWGILWPDGLMRHPITLYLSLSALLIFIILELLKKRLPRKSSAFFLFLLLFSLSTFFLGFLRIDPSYFGISVGQWASILLSIIMSFYFVRSYFYRRFIKGYN